MGSGALPSSHFYADGIRNRKEKVGMKLNILILAHRDAVQIREMIEAFSHPDVRFFIHIDQDSQIDESLLDLPYVSVVPALERISVQWGKVSQVQAMLRLLGFALRRSDEGYYLLISGQDYPCRRVEDLLKFLEENEGSEFVDVFSESGLNSDHFNRYDLRLALYYPEWMIDRHLMIRIIKKIWMMAGSLGLKVNPEWKRNVPFPLTFAHGSCWYCISREFASYVLDQIRNKPQILTFFRNVLNSDESFIQTMLMSSPFSDHRKEYLHYIDWSADKSSPKVLTEEDFTSIENSECYIIRKVEREASRSLLERLERKNSLCLTQ